MKKHSYGKLIRMSWDWTCEVLFRPFNLKKWIMLGIILTLAGQLGSCNLNANLRPDKRGARHAKTVSVDRVSLPRLSPGEIREKAASAASNLIDILHTNILFAVLIFLAAISIAIIIVLWSYIMTVFSFVFIESVVKNDASIRIPFHKNKALGASYFFWNAAFGAVSISVFAVSAILSVYSLFRSGVLSGLRNMGALAILGAVKPYLIIIASIFVFFMLINIFATNFVQIIMYSRKVGVKRAWWIFLVFLARNFFEILLYLLVKFGLFLLGVLVFLVLTIIGILIILIIGGALTLIGFLIYILTPASAKPIVSVVITVIGVPSFAVLLFVVRFIILPIPVFFRLFSIHFLGSIDSSFDPFVRCSEEIEKGEDTEKYKKSMALVWMAIFSPLIPALLIIAALFAGGPTLAKTCFPKKEPPAAISAPESAEPAKEAKAIGEKQIKKILPLRNIKANYVKIYLKNGRSLEAEIVKEDPNAITFGMEGGTFTLSRESIERIEQKNK